MEEGKTYTGGRYYVTDKEVADWMDSEKRNRLIGEIYAFLPREMKFSREEWLTVLTGAAPLRGVLACKWAEKHAPEPRTKAIMQNWALPDHIEGSAQYYTEQLGDIRIPVACIEWMDGDVPVINKDRIADMYPQLYCMVLDGLLCDEEATKKMEKAREANKLLGGRKQTYKDVPRVFAGFPGYRFYYEPGEVLPFRVQFIKKAYPADVLRERIHIR